MSNMRFIAGLTVEPNPNLPAGPASVSFGSIPASAGYLEILASIAAEGIGVAIPSAWHADTVSSAGRTSVRMILPWQSSLTVRPAGAETFPVGSTFALYERR